MRNKRHNRVRKPLSWKVGLWLLIGLIMLMWAGYAMQIEASNKVTVTHMDEEEAKAILAAHQWIPAPVVHEAKQKEDEPSIITVYRDVPKEVVVYKDQLEAKDAWANDLIYSIKEWSRYGKEDTLEMIVTMYYESGWNSEAVGKNRDKVGSTDRGYYQLNDFWHKDTSAECAKDIKCATEKAMKIFESRGKSFSAWYANKHYKKIK